jgi:hypothetical protein
MGQAFGRGMGTVSRRKGIIHIGIAQCCHRSDKLCRIFFFTRMKTRIFKNSDCPGRKSRNARRSSIAHAIINKFNGSAKHGRQSGHDLAQGHIVAPFPFGSAKMGEDKNLCPPIRQFKQGGRGGTQTHIV